MKLLLAILIALSGLTTQAATNLLSLTYVNGTNNGNVYYASNIFVPRQRFIIQSLGLTNPPYATLTNALEVNIQISVDGSNTNWLTLATWHPATTNATVETLNDEFDRIALPIRAQVITTNAIGVSIFNQ